METVTLTIDDQPITTDRGTTVLDAALAHGIYIPNLCHDPDLEPAGACRLCLVEVEGRGTTIACRAPAENGMIVKTSTPAVEQTRRIGLELILASHPLDCLVCARNNDCALQTAAGFIGVDPQRMARMRRITKDLPVDRSNPFFDLDHGKCILCGICVRTCDEIMNIGAIDFAFRGFDTQVAAFGGKPMFPSACVSCGECVARCPVAALVPRHFQQPVRETASICPYCGVGCGLLLGTRGGRVVRVRGERDNPANKGRLCVKGRFGQDFVNHADRLTDPLIKRNGRFEKATWDEALDLAARRLGQIKAEHGGGAFATLASAKCSNEENYVIQKFTRAVLGNNNVDHCARLCHSSTVAGLAAAFGSGAMTNSIDEIEGSDVFLITGSNTTENHPVLSLHIKKALRRGTARLILADPRRIPLAPFAHLHLQQACGTDVALFNGFMHVIIAENLHDKAFIAERTEGFEALKNTVEKYTPAFVEQVTGVPQADLVAAARLYATAGKASIFFAMGITQHTNGTDNVLSIANLAMLTGNLGRESTGVNPLRGQNNVQGACDMGCLPNVYPGYQKVTDDDARAKFEAAWGTSLSGQVGLTIMEMMNAADEGKVRAMYFMGENPAMSDPDAHHVCAALKKLDFLVVQDIFLNETAELADVVLPAASYAEKDGTVTNTERRVQKMRKALEPIGQSRTDWRTTCEIATRMGYPMKYESAAEILDEIATVTPIYGGIHADRLDNGGLQWPCPDRGHGGTRFLHKDKFTHGLGKFHAVEFKGPDEKVDEAYPLLLTTGRTLYHFHTIMTRKVDGLNAICPEATLEMSPADAEPLGIAHGDYATVSSRRGTMLARAEVTDIPVPGTVFTTFHFKEAAANWLTIAALDPVAKIPEYKVCAVRVEKSDRAPEPTMAVGPSD